MVSPQLTDFLTSLNHSEFISDLASVCQASLSSHPQVEYVDEEVGRVANILYESVLVSQQQDGIGSQVLRRVVNKFRTSVDTQSLQMQILDALLLKARTDYGVKTADVPVIVQLRRDRPILRPDSLLLGNAASRLLQLLTDEQQRPSALEGDTEAILGRLLLHLFFMERVESLEQALFLAKSAPRLTYLDGLVFIEANFKDELCRYALSEAGVLWWSHWLRHSPSISAWLWASTKLPNWRMTSNARSWLCPVASRTSTRRLLAASISWSFMPTTVWW